jgi:hypothetical protein
MSFQPKLPHEDSDVLLLQLLHGNLDVLLLQLPHENLHEFQAQTSS